MFEIYVYQSVCTHLYSNICDMYKIDIDVYTCLEIYIIDVHTSLYILHNRRKVF